MLTTYPNCTLWISRTFYPNVAISIYNTAEGVQYRATLPVTTVNPFQIALALPDGSGTVSIEVVNGIATVSFTDTFGNKKTYVMDLKTGVIELTELLGDSVRQTTLRPTDAGYQEAVSSMILMTQKTMQSWNDP